MRKPNEIIVNGKALEEILGNHLHWLRQDVFGWEEMRANLDGTNLSDANLRGANLSRTNLSDADLRYANLRDANLRDADLSDADLRGDDLRYSDLRGADLCGADLRYSDLHYSDLRGADLRGADLCGADLRGAINVPYIPLECPSDGAFIGWKRVKDVLIKLEIPADAKRSSATTRKCRCEKAKVLGFYDSLDSQELNMTELVNDRYEECKYVKGEMVYPDYFDDNRWNECSHGIHFFINKQDAINY